MPYIYKSGLQFGINETNIYGGAEYVELTQAEYDALSDAEKHNGQIYFITDGNYDFLIVNDSVPIGSIQAYGGITAPSNWLICDGRAVSRTEYSELFAAVGITYGAGDGTSTFNLPDLQGRVAIGKSASYELGATGGEATHILVENELPSIEGHWGIHSQETGTIFYNAYNNATGEVYSGSYKGLTSPVSGASSLKNPGFAFGNDEAHNNMQPYTVTNYIIKAKNPSVASGQQLQIMELFYPVGSYYETSDADFNPNTAWGGTWVKEVAGQVHVSAGTGYSISGASTNTSDGGEVTHTLTVDEMPSHKHTFSNSYGWTGDFIPGASATLSGTSNILASPYHAYTGSTNNLTINTSGGSQAHNNMQPYIVVNRWHRIA